MKNIPNNHPMFFYSDTTIEYKDKKISDIFVESCKKLLE